MKKLKEKNENRTKKVNKKKHTKEVKKEQVLCTCFAGQLKGFPEPHSSPNYQRWISKIIQTKHKFADCGGAQSPWPSSALLNITRNLSIITEGLLSTRPNCSNNFNYFPWQILCFMYFSGLIIMISLISRYRA